MGSEEIISEREKKGREKKEKIKREKDRWKCWLFEKKVVSLMSYFVIPRICFVFIFILYLIYTLGSFSLVFGGCHRITGAIGSQIAS